MLTIVRAETIQETAITKFLPNKGKVRECVLKRNSVLFGVPCAVHNAYNVQGKT